MLGIIADDLTGANDTGVQFAKKGLDTVTLLSAFEMMPQLPEGPKVVVLNTQSRGLKSYDAYVSVKKEAEKLIHYGVSPIYKKIDSVLRGNPGSELIAVMDALEFKVGVVAPAFPDNNRIVAGGYLLPDGVTMRHGSSEGINAIELLEQQTEKRVGLLCLEEVRRGVDYLRDYFARIIETGEDAVILVDAIHRDDLRTLAKAVVGFLSKIVLAGSGGLTGELPEALGLVGTDREGVGRGRPVLIVIGSYHPITAGQVNWLLERQLVRAIVADPLKLTGEESREEIARVTDSAESSIKAGWDTAIVVNTLLEPFGLPEHGLTRGSILLDGKETEQIVDALGRVTATVVKEGLLSGLVLSGGDTAVHVCNALGSSGIRLLDEILPGIPCGRLIGGTREGLLVVTKSGGFGTPEAIEKVIRYIARVAMR